MFQPIKRGFATMRSQPFLLFVLWLYQFTWGFVLLLFIRSIVVPLMHRYPGEHLASSASQLFLAEGQFRLLKTDLSMSYLVLLLALTVARMLLTPVINAGVYYSVHHAHLNPGYRFLQGIRQLSKSFFGYYIIQLLLTLAPLYWIYPVLKQVLLGNYTDLISMAAAVLPWAGSYIVYGYLIHLCFVYLLLGRTTQSSMSQSFGRFLRRLPLLLFVTIVLLLLSALVTVAAASLSLLWAGISALLLQQLFHAAKLLFRIWTLGSHYDIFTSK